MTSFSYGMGSRVCVVRTNCVDYSDDH